MIRRTIPVLFLLIFLAQLGVQGSLAMPQYLTNLTAVYGDGSCATCHVNPSGGGTLTPYGSLFASQPNHAADPSSALIAAGTPPGMNATPNATMTGTAVATAGATTTATAAATMTAVPIETLTPAMTPPVSTPMVTETPVTTPTTTPRSPGFGLAVSLVGLLLACLLLWKRRN
ncbi:MAG: PGF-CTERM sorting domain-containing protein [Candidatus Methanoperedens sp.]|nr:PGF-CTERM sorting domain-containing protein [Candidatus Methanoperedens sp.]